MDHKDIFNRTGQHLKNMLETIGDTDLIPRSTNNDGSLRMIQPRDWCSGFFPGCLWMQYEITNDDFWKTSAEKFTDNVKDEQFNGGTHDMGFKMFCSYGSGLRLTGTSEYRDILVQSADTLITRFNENTGCIRSWDHNTDKWQFPVIIDNLMNLELLFWASKETGDSKYAEIAVTHADTTLRNHFRDDNSSYHVLDYDPQTGEVVHRHTHQGYAHESAWARGQAWGIYGYTMIYRETGDVKYLNQAVKIADYILGHENFPDDSIPYWDFDDPVIPEVPRDASAGAIICSGLYELSAFLGEEGSRYRACADAMLESLASPAYLAERGSNNNFAIQHCVGNMNENDEVDKPISYGDYYFMEAALRKMKLESQEKI